MEQLIPYFEERLTKAVKAGLAGALGIYQRDFSGHLECLAQTAGLSAESHALEECSKSGEAVLRDKLAALPVYFATSPLGVLAGSNVADVEKLKALAAQLGAVWQLPEPKAGIFLDRKMEELTALYPVFDWCGIYRLVGDTLYLTCFRGAPTPHPIIPQSRGICGAAVAENRTLNIEDVTSDPRYLSCDIRTKSELVVPVRDKKGNPVGEIDIDSHKTAAFTQEIASHVEETAREIAPLLVELTM